VIAPPIDLQEGYRVGFDAYVRAPSEAALRVAYELGREAVGRELSVLDLATFHHETLLAALERTPPADVESLIRGANDFFLEALSAFEMLSRGFREVQRAVVLERHHALILRQLSNFLADASLALNSADSLGEVLQLVAEQARELTGAECSVARVSVAGGEEGTIDAVSHSAADARWDDCLARADLNVLTDLVDESRGSARLSGADLTRQSLDARNWLAATLTGWDGARLGSIHLLNKEDGDFAEGDEAVLVQLAQMAVTAVERARRSA
jgi:hypothetical protein